MAADRLHAAIGLAHEKARPATRNNQRKNSLMAFEIGQIIIGEKHFSALPANKRTHWQQSIGRPGSEDAHIIIVPNAEQQATGLIHHPVEARDPSQRETALGLRTSF
jgi:hypothetical protein